MKTTKPTPETTRLDPQAVALLTEARETIRDQAEAIGSLTANLEEAQREARALNATVDNLTANLSRANTEINRLNAMLAKAQEARDAHRKALGLAEQDGTILDAIEHLRREVETLHENVAQAKRERDLALTKRDEALAQVKDMEECPTEILGSSIFTRRGNRIHLHYNLTEQGEGMTRSEFTALASVVSAHAAGLIHELTGNGEA